MQFETNDLPEQTASANFSAGDSKSHPSSSVGVFFLGFDFLPNLIVTFRSCPTEW
jgi:hypothetical protein